MSNGVSLPRYIVANALRIAESTRIGWTGYDLLYGDKKIEVKSSSFLQSWKQRALSQPRFGIGAREQWDEESGLSSDPRYVADAFVFCLFAHCDPDTADVLDLSQWRFYVVATEILRRRVGSAKSISAQRLESLTAPCTIGKLRERVDGVLANSEAFIFAEQPPKGLISEPATARYTSAVAQRGTRANPVIVTASDYLEAFERARSDEKIKSFGADISAIRLSTASLTELVNNGALDLR